MPCLNLKFSVGSISPLLSQQQIPSHSKRSVSKTSKGYSKYFVEASRQRQLPAKANTIACLGHLERSKSSTNGHLENIKAELQIAENESLYLTRSPLLVSNIPISLRIMGEGQRR